MKSELGKWKKDIDEVSNCVWKVTLTHELGSTIEKIGEDLYATQRRHQG